MDTTSIFPFSNVRPKKEKMEYISIYDFSIFELKMENRKNG